MTNLPILDELRALGKPQFAKTYRRHGADENVFGVSTADMKTLVKRIKVDHDLAQKLWASGNHDARILATMIADPNKADADLLEQWASDLKDYPVSDALGVYVARTPIAREIMEKWTQSDSEWSGAVGWNVLGAIARSDETLNDAYFEKYLAIIERDIHTQKNRIRHSMNNALIAIGTRKPALEQKALEVAGKIGKVMVDHGNTDCKTPDAASYIKKTLERKKAKA
jgi:3-methyladenine DNA glycosylase AlkD